jgi:hypothetical protein
MPLPSTRRFLSVVAGPIGAAMLFAAAAMAQTPDDLQLKRVLLSTGGVGYFEYEATITGDQTLSLQVRLDQVNDVLKSIVVYDDRGGIGEISLPGREPLEEVFREMPFGPEALASPLALLNALRGAEVEAAGLRSLSGRLIAVTAETAQLPNNGGTVTQHRVSLLTEAGVRQFILEEADTLRFVDPALQAQVDEALAALAQHNERDRRVISIRTFGEGERTVRVAYVVEAPLWKSTYRLTLSDDPAATTAELQGWAVLENLSGEDWAGVDLTIVSGNPVTFQQALYQAYYVDRPEVPVEVLGRVMPRVDTGTVRERLEQQAGLMGGDADMLMPMQEPPMEAAESYAYEETMSRAAGAAAPPPASAMIAAAESTEATTQVVFHVPEPISVASGHSVMVPIVSLDIAAAQLSLYQRETHATNPLASVRLTNDGASGLPPGILTLYERSAASGLVSFVGDAQMSALPAGDERLLSFALDQKVKVLREDEGSQTIAGGRIADGLLELTLIERTTTTYTVEGAPREPRTVVLEHERPDGWKLIVDDSVPVERTDAHYRLSLDLAPGQTKDLVVSLERPVSQQVSLIDMSDDWIEYYASARQLSPEVREAIRELRRYKAEVLARENEIARLREDYQEIVGDQERIRANLDSVPRETDLHRRYLETMSAQEEKLAGLSDAIATAEDALEAARDALRAYARSLKL